MNADAGEPWIPDFEDNSPWRWEWIQDDEAFHYDVSNAAHKVKDVNDFRTKLALRREKRLQ
ncbi:hypothetical protein B0T21DRAFT_407697 [Apiosordaria backusii]|uniref:Uncharacterized protein n=1 Tax=Apiosordaria backusii TaxID=314023 RepID=A0AA40ESC3_9PEZI|nr:hypothetical protein B0T21DRAFT_407697 [Apiosordaria backusii]